MIEKIVQIRKSKGMSRYRLSQLTGISESTLLRYENGDIKKASFENIIKICVVAHDEFNLECPENMAEEVAKILVKCMIAGGKPFCPNVFLGADISSHHICIKDYYFNGDLIMKEGDTIAVIGEKVYHNLRTGKKYLKKELPKDHYNALSSEGPLPTYWIH